ncbi:short-chain dehydrogenase [Kytococcus sedentarius]|uniref:short-chain dehydrogenase n=1 Tax=Kytococcus sedentarius TaxID=1276 RepID=UPI00387A439B
MSPLQHTVGPAQRLLVVGGTGMLLGTVEGLLADGHELWVLARRTPALEHPRLHPLVVDYGDATGLDTALTHVTGAAGPFDGAVVWTHSSAPHAPEVVARHVAGPFLHVLGSTTADPSRPRPTPDWAGAGYRTMVLGFVREADHSRWLTNPEIAAGVLEAWRTGAARTVVGTVEPWSARP